MENHDKGPSRFQIVDVEGKYDFLKPPPLRENVIVHYLQPGFGNEKFHRFMLLRVIDGLRYIFTLWENPGENYYGINFKTEEYEYAITHLSQGGRKKLTDTLSAFLDSVRSRADVSVDGIEFLPADTNFSSHEVDTCINAILALPKNPFSREEIKEQYKGRDIFELYKTFARKNFPIKKDEFRNALRSRRRFFQRMISKDLPELELDDKFSDRYRFKKK